jgi:hypothetical protein
VADAFTFDGFLHEYRFAGVRVPSVTQVLDPLLELWRVPAPVLAAAAAFGTNVHLACHLWNLGRLDPASLDAPLVPYLTGWQRFVAATGFRLTMSEPKVYHSKLRYAGGPDAVGMIPTRGVDQLCLIDWKSGAVPITVGPQTAAYCAAMEDQFDLKIRRRLCVQLTAEEPFYRVLPLTDPSDFSLFLSALNIHKFKERHHGSTNR